MGQLVTVSLDTQPDIFTYQGKFFKRVVGEYDLANFNLPIKETLREDIDGYIVPRILPTGEVLHLDNNTGADIMSMYIQTSEVGTPTMIAIIDAFLDTSIFSTTTNEDDDTLSFSLADLDFTSPETQQIRLKGILYEITFFGFDTQTELVGSAAFKIQPVTESLLKTTDYNLIPTMDGTGYIDIIASPI